MYRIEYIHSCLYFSQKLQIGWYVHCTYKCVAQNSKLFESIQNSLFYFTKTWFRSLVLKLNILFFNVTETESEQCTSNVYQLFFCIFIVLLFSWKLHTLHIVNIPFLCRLTNIRLVEKEDNRKLTDITILLTFNLKTTLIIVSVEKFLVWSIWMTI